MATIKPIAYIKTDFNEKFGVPRQSGRAKTFGEIVFSKEYSSPEAVRGLEEFDYIYLIFDFSLSHTEKWSPTVRPPRLGGNKRVGVFATRSPNRPNFLGLSSVKLLQVKINGNNVSLIVEGADLVDGTPIYDIKPYIPYCDSHPNARGSYAEENKEYKLKVEFENGTQNILAPDKTRCLEEILADDPRPSYKEEGDRVYSMLFANYNVSFKVIDGTVKVQKIEK